MKWIWWESKSKTANKPLYWTSFDEVAFYMPTWNCTKIKRVRRIVNTAWVDIKFWSLRRWNRKTQLLMMEVDEVEIIFTHTSPSYLFWRSKFGTKPYLLIVCICFQSNTSQLRESNYIRDWWALEHILWDLLKLGTMAQVFTHRMLIKAPEISDDHFPLVVTLKVFGKWAACVWWW